MVAESDGYDPTPTPESNFDYDSAFDSDSDSDSLVRQSIYLKLDLAKQKLSCELTVAQNNLSFLNT